MVTNSKKKGILWANNYANDPLNNSGLCAEGFYSTLLPQGSSYNSFRNGDASSLPRKAFDTDIQHKKEYFRQDANSGNTVLDFIYPPGEDELWAETVDMLYFCGHGDPGHFHFVQPNNTLPYSDRSAHYDDIFLGDGKIKWLVADACQVLENNQLQSGQWSIFLRWAKVFKPNGSLRYMLGFHTLCKNDNVRGRYFAEKLNPIGGGTQGERIRVAWAYACELTDNAEWAYLRVGNANSGVKNDRWTDTNLANVPTVPANGSQTFTYQKRVGPTGTTIMIIS